MHGRFSGAVTDGDLIAHVYWASWSVLPRRGAAIVWSATLSGDRRRNHDIEGRFPLAEAVTPGVLPASDAGRHMIQAAVKVRAEAAVMEVVTRVSTGAPDVAGFGR
jgi:hypothetical protein